MRSTPTYRITGLLWALVVAAVAIGLGWIASTSPFAALVLAIVAAAGFVALLKGRKPGMARARPSGVVLGSVIVALAPIDTIDLSGGRLGFALTPWLLLSIPYAFVLLLRDEPPGDDGPTGTRLPHGLWIAFCLVTVATVSVFLLNIDPFNVSLKRLVLTAWLITFAFFFIRRNKDIAREVIVRGTKAFLVLQAAAVAIESVIVVTGFKLPEAFTKYVDLTVVYVGNQARLKGLIVDPNRAAVDLLLMVALAHLCVQASKSKTFELGWWPYALVVVLVALTYSRTGFVAGLLICGVLAFKADWRFRRWLVAGAMIGAASISYVLLTQPNLAVTIGDAFSNRQRQTATTTHFRLIETGIDVATGDVKTFLVGAGWGTEYFYTYQFFPGDKHGNFHSGFVSTAVNGGVLALLAYIALMVRPLLLRLPWRGIVFVLLWINLFYQFQAEPIYWIVLAALNAGWIQGADARAATAAMPSLNRPGSPALQAG